MSSLSFIRSTVVAVLLSIAASAIYYSMTILFSNEFSIRLVISIVTFAYIFYLLTEAEMSFGKLSFGTAYILSTAAMVALNPPLLAFALFHVGFIWLIRTVYYHHYFLLSLIDLVFSIVSFTAAIGAILHSHSLFISFWSFFLTQALILPMLHHLFNKYQNPRLKPHPRNTHSQHDFQQAHRNAEDALHKLARHS